MNRTRFYNIVINDSIPELDYLDNTLSAFTLKYEPTYYRVGEYEEARPDLISYKFYSTAKYWWILLLVNNIENVFEGIKTGTILQIPSIIDIYEFYKKYKVR